jgi:hypothetical protein
LAVVKLTTVQVAKLPLSRKINKIGMICYTKSGLTENLYIVQKEELSITCYMCNMYLKRPTIFIREKPTHSSERMLHKG